MKALIESAGNVASRVWLGKHQLVFDQPPGVPGGNDRGPSPLEVMAVSVGACAHYFAAAYLHRRGMATDALQVEVTTEKERVPVPRLGRFRITVHLPAGLSSDQVTSIERAIKTCPAYGTLLHPPAVELVVASPAAPPAAPDLASA